MTVNPNVNPDPNQSGEVNLMTVDRALAIARDLTIVIVGVLMILGVIAL